MTERLDVDELDIYQHRSDPDVHSVIGFGVTGTLEACLAWCRRWARNVPLTLINTHTPGGNAPTRITSQGASL